MPENPAAEWAFDALINMMIARIDEGEHSFESMANDLFDNELINNPVSDNCLHLTHPDAKKPSVFIEKLDTQDQDEYEIVVLWEDDEMVRQEMYDDDIARIESYFK